MEDRIGEISKKIENLKPEEGMKYLSDCYPGKVVFSTSFGLEDQVITDMISTSNIPVRIFTLDTGRLFQETYDVMEYTKNKYKADIETFFPNTSAIEKLLREKGPNSFYHSVDNRKECCRIRKIEPLKTALKGMSVWITGLRAEQSEHRAEMKKTEWDESNNIIKYHPILAWTFEDVKEYIRKNKVPANALHESGFPSIGCAPCTRAIQPGEDFRAGRWWWEASHKECGLHK
jgi:phosphoadenosine phosphosulfate reductase